MQTTLTNKPSINYKLLAEKKEGESVLDAILKSRGITNKEEFLNPLSSSLSDPYFF